MVLDCPRCSHWFPTAKSPDVIPCEPRPKTSSAAALALGVMVLAFCLLASVLGLLVGPRQEQGGSTTATAKPREDPYTPDCAIIRAWLKRSYGEVEVTSWGHRTVVITPFGGSASLSCRFRRPGERTKSGFFTIGPYDTVETSVISD